jgi:hypothetical protein
MSGEIVATSNFLKDYATLIAVPAAALVGSIAYRMQKAVDRKTALIELRRKTYINYLEALFKLVAMQTPENNLTHNLRLMELSAVASDEVVKKIGILKQYLMDPESRSGNIENATAQILVGEAVLTMRKDCFESSELTIPDIIKITPFGPPK